MPKIVFSPKFPKSLVDVLMEMKPAGFDIAVVDATGPGFLAAA
jgi:hypothetical protein